MDFAADAVVEVVTPQPRPSQRAHASNNAEDAVSFDERLEALADEDASAETAPAAKESDETKSAAAPKPDAVVIETPPQPASPAWVLQVINTPPQQTPTAPTQAPAETPIAPTQGAVVPLDAQLAAPAPQPSTQQTSTTQTQPQTNWDAQLLGAETLATEQSVKTQIGAPEIATPLPTVQPAAQMQAVMQPANLQPQPNGDAAIQSQAVQAAGLDAGTQAQPLAQATSAPVPSPVQQDKAPSADVLLNGEDAAFEPTQAAPQPQSQNAAPNKAQQKSAANADAGAKSTPQLASIAPNAQDAQAGPNQLGALTPSGEISAAQQTASAEHSAPRTGAVAAQVGREIIRRFDGGSTRFELRLDPPELGRVDVRLEVTRDHRVTAVISADSPQALTDLVRHARELEQNLQSAGLDLSDKGLSFDLRQDSESARDGERNGGANFNGGEIDADQQRAEALPQTARLERWRGVRVDVMA